jgi:hypothetical protein
VNRLRVSNYFSLTGLAFLLVCLAILILYSSSLPAYFVADDFGFVQLLSQKPPLHFLSLFTRRWSEDIWGEIPVDEIRPMVALSYQVNSLWGAASPVAYHATNIFLHGLNALLVFATGRVIARLTLAASSFASLLFAILPSHAEAVAYITGRSDTILAFFYVSSLLAYVTWRRNRSHLLYAACLCLFFSALFSKEVAVTLLPAFILSDVLIQRLWIKEIWLSFRYYTPFACLTVGYLMVRYSQFSSAVREDQVSPRQIAEFAVRQIRYAEMLLGARIVQSDSLHQILALTAGIFTVTPVLLLLISLYAQLPRASCTSVSARGWCVVYFGPVWWLLSVAPLTVTYESPRHLYLPAVGFAILVAMGFQILWRLKHNLWRYASYVGAIIVLLAYSLQLRLAVEEWNRAASISEKIIHDVQHRARYMPAGSLLIVGAPARGPGGIPSRPRIWSWAMPFALQAPFVPSDLIGRFYVVEPYELYCCSTEEWFVKTRDTLRAWSERSDAQPVLVLSWDASTGAIVEQSDLQNPQLRSQLLDPANSNTYAQTHSNLRMLLSQMRAGATS